METISEFPEVYPVTVPASLGLKTFNCYIVKTNHTLILIDACINSEACWNELQNVLRNNGWEVEDLDKIILTHNHGDHTGLVNRIRQVKDIPVYAHQKAISRLKREEAFMQQRILFFKSLYAKMGCGRAGDRQVKKMERAMQNNKETYIRGDIQLIEEGDQLDGFNILEVPGHAPDHIALFHPESQILFAGDHIVKHISSNALVEPDANGNRIPSLMNYEASIEKCLEYPLAVVYSGHGDVVENPTALLEWRLERIKVKSDQIKSLIQEESLTAAQIAKLYYGKKYETEFSLVMSEIIGHLDRLEALHQVTVQQSGDLLYYQAISEEG